MSVNKTQNAQDSPSNSEEQSLLSEGSNTELLAVRVSPQLMGVVQARAKKINRSVPELVRFYLLFQLLPDMTMLLAERARKGAVDLSLFSSTYFQLQGAQEELLKNRAQIAQARKQLDALERINEKAIVRFDEVGREATIAWSQYIEQLGASPCEATTKETTQ